MPDAVKSIWEQNATPRHRIQWCPGCGDYAVLKLRQTEKDAAAGDVAAAGLFDDFWQLPKGGE